MRKLTDTEMESISESAAVAAENYIFSKISKKEVLDMEVRVEFHEEEGLDVDVEVELFLDELSKAEDTLADESAEAAHAKMKDTFSRLLKGK